jgi:hypothetical protein
MANIGTVQTKYSKDWIYLNPAILKGPDAWNVANFPQGSAIPQILSVPPIMVEQVAADVALSYSIIDCKGLDEVNRQLLASDTPAFPQSTLSNIQEIQGELPIARTIFDEDTILYFSIQDLNSTSALFISDNLDGYNRSNIDSLTTSLPLEAGKTGGIATVSFDITTLQDA